MTANTFYITDNILDSVAGEIFFLRDRKKTRSNAFTTDEKIRIIIKIPRSLGISFLNLDFYNENGNDIIFSKTADWYRIEDSFDIYQVSQDAKKLGKGLFFFEVTANSIFGKIYTKGSVNSLIFSKSETKYKFQLTISDFLYEEPTNVYGGIIYHIFVDRFAKSNKNSYINKSELSWDDPIPEFPAYPGASIKNQYLYGGDLWGIADKIQYLKSLGVSIIYLSPIFESPSNHKYDTSDYMKVDSVFGGEDALVHLIETAKREGIYIILDGVFNHTGADSKYFNKYGNYSEIGAYNSVNSKYYNWYEFESYPDKYTSWWGIEILPKINPDIPSLRNYLSGDGGVIDKYMKLGILGLRLDVVDELSDSFISSIKAQLNKSNKNSYLIGEVWEDASNKIAYGSRKEYYLGSELDGVMNYPVRTGIISFLRHGDDAALKYALTDVIFNAPKRIRDSQMNIIGTHDTERIITVLGGEESKGKSNQYLSTAKMSSIEYETGKKKLLMAYTFLATIPGIPSIYYGDEVGLEGYSDPFNRRTFPWNDIDEEILSHYKKIGKIRRENPVYKDGEFNLNYLEKGILVFSRNDGLSSYITVLNNTQDVISIKLSKTSISLFNQYKANCFDIKPLTSIIIKSPLNNRIEF